MSQTVRNSNLTSYLSAASKGGALWLVALVLMAMAGACAGDGEIPTPPEQREGLTAVFTLSVPLTNGANVTRAPGTLGDGYDTGEGLESFIDLDARDFRFMFFDSNDRYIETLDVFSIVPVGEAATTRDYQVSGNVTEALVDATVKVMALANWGDYSFELKKGETTIDDICVSDASLYEFGPALMQLSEDNLIPMYGITNPRRLQFDGAGKADVDRIYLLRAYAKVEIVLSRPDDTYLPLVADNPVRLTSYSVKGYCAPKGVTSQNDYVHYDYDSDYVATPHIPSDARHRQTVPIQKVADDRYIAYVPEYRNIGRPDNERASLLLRFEGDSSDERIEFCIYSNNRPTDRRLDLLRNNWYRFTVSKRQVLDVTVQMVPYAEVSLEPDYGFVGEYQLEPIYDANGTLIYWFNPITGSYYHDEDGMLPLLPGELTVNTDPVTGWNLVRDFSGAFVCFHNAGGEGTIGEVGYYAYDGKTRIKSPVEGEYYDSRRWYSITGYDDNYLYYYHNHWTSACYATSDESSRIYSPFPEAEYAVTGELEWLPYYRFDGHIFAGYLRVSDKKWYDRNKEKEIPDPFK